MKPFFLILAVTVQLAAAGTVHAQQMFGRGSVYAIPGRSTTPSNPVMADPAPHFGRDSVYARDIRWRLSRPDPSLVAGPPHYGRDSVYGYGAPNPSAPTTGQAQAGTAPRGHGG